MSYKDEISRRQFVKVGSGAVAVGVFAGLAGCSSGSGSGSASGSESSSGSASGSAASSAATQTITDNAGDTVEVPTTVNKVCDLWHAHNQVMLMLGAGDLLVGTTENFKKRPWANAVYPRLSEVEALVTGTGAGEVNYEECLSLQPDVVFTSDDDVTATCRQKGLTTVNVKFNNYEGLRRDVELTGQILGGDAEDIAKEWESLLDANIAKVEKAMSGVSDADKPKVLHTANAKEFTKVDGVKTIVDEWIKLAGGVNAMTIEGNMQEVTMEDIVAADPEIIIIGGGNEEAVNNLLNDPAWSGITAVKNKAVYGNPNGVFAWDRYSGEEALQVLWAAQKLNPDKFKDIDMVKETQDFYMQFYGYDLSKENAERILQGLDPA